MVRKSQSSKSLLSKSDLDWENVLNEINVEKLPIKYLTQLRLNLKTGKVAIIDVRTILLESGNEDAASKKVNDLLRVNKDRIVSMDFSIDVGNLKKSITRARNKFTKKVNFNIKRGKNKDD